MNSIDFDFRVSMLDLELAPEKLNVVPLHVTKIVSTCFPAICALPNFLDENDVLNWAGVGFSSGKAAAIMNSLRHFAATTEGLKKVPTFLV